MRILICDDDMLMIEQLKKLITGYFKERRFQCPELSCFSDGESLLADTKEKDILFLDVEMPGMNGIYIGNELKKHNKDIIIFIVTSHSHYLDDAMRFHVFRYLSKPLDHQRFYRNMKEAMDMYHSMTFKLPIETKQGVHTLSASSIIFIEAQSRKVTIHTLEKDYDSIHPIWHWQSLLPRSSFFQTHRSFIINLKYVTDFDRTIIHLANNQFQAYLTKRKYSAFKEAYLLYLESTR